MDLLRKLLQEAKELNEQEPEKDKIPPEKTDIPKEDELPPEDLETPEETPEEQSPLDFEKLYFGRREDKHFYVVVEKNEEDEPEDLQVVDQEGNQVFSAKENNLDINNVSEFIKSAIEDTNVDVAQIERSLVMQYLIPPAEEVMAAEEEEEELEPDLDLDLETELEEPGEAPPVKKENPMESKQANEAKMGIDYVHSAKSSMKKASTAMKDKNHEEAIKALEDAADDCADAAKALKKMKRESDAKEATDKEKNEAIVNEQHPEEVYGSSPKDARFPSDEEEIPGGLADDKSPEDFNPEQLEMGIKVEMEHTDDPAKAKEIAMDHLVEDPEYYTHLQKMENESKTDEKCKSKSMKKKVKESDLNETQEVKDSKGNSFSVILVEEGNKNTVLQINKRDYRFDSEFAHMFGSEEGKLTEQGIQELALETIKHLNENDYAELIGSGKVKESDSLKKGPNVDPKLEKNSPDLGNVDEKDEGSSLRQHLHKKKDALEKEKKDFEEKWNRKMGDLKVELKKIGESMTIQKAVKEGKIKENSELMILGKKGKITKIDESSVTVNVVDDAGASLNVNVQGDANLNVSPEGVIAVIPASAQNPPQSEMDQMAAAESSPVDNVPAEGELGHEEAAEQTVKPEEEEKEKELGFESKQVKESYGDVYIESDIKKGLPEEQIIKKITSRYPKITPEQAKQIYNNVKSGKSGGWDKIVGESKTNERKNPADKVSFDFFGKDYEELTEEEKKEVKRELKKLGCKAIESKTNEAHGDMVGHTKEVYEVAFEKDGKKNSTRVMAFDEAAAKEMLAKKPGVKVVSVKKVSKEDTKEECAEAKDAKKTKVTKESKVKKVKLTRKQIEEAEDNEAFGGINAVRSAQKLLGLNESSDIDTISMGDTIQILDRNNMSKVVVVEAVVKKMNENKGYEITGSDIEDEQKWYGNDMYWFIKL